MSRLRFLRPAAALASAALAAALAAPPSFGQSSDARRLYRIEVIVFGYEEGDPTEELFAHTAARASMQAVDADTAIDTFDFAPYLPPPGEEPFGAGADDWDAGQRAGDGRRDRRLLGADEPSGAEIGAEREGAADRAAETSVEAFGNAAGEGPGASGAGADDAVVPDPFGPTPAHAAAGFRFRLLAPEELELVDAHRRLERLDAYTPLVHGGWVQEGLPLRDAKPFDLAYLGASNPAGTIRLHLSRYLHLAVDLVYRPQTGRARAPEAAAAPGDGGFAAPGVPRRAGAAGSGSSLGVEALSDVAVPARYVLRAERRIGSGIVQYFDHPMFGVLVLVEPYEPPARTASDSGPAA